MLDVLLDEADIPFVEWVALNRGTSRNHCGSARRSARDWVAHRQARAYATIEIPSPTRW